MVSEPPTFNKLFRKNTALLQAANLLADSFVPDTVVARNDQMDIMAYNLSPILDRGQPTNMYIWGDTGVGKTITIQYILKILADGLKQDDNDTLIDVVKLNCTSIKSEVPACIEILSTLTGITVKTGRLFYEYLKDIWTVIDKKSQEHSFYTLILVFDEIDLFTVPDDILYQFSRALSHRAIDAKNVAIELIIASNMKNFLQTLDDKVLSSAGFRYCNFPDYNEEELYEILQTRKGAFVEGVISDEVIMYCAKKVSERHHGDARRAIQTLAEAAKVAGNEKACSITINNVDEAEKIIAARATLEMLKKITLHDRLLLLSAHISSKILKREKYKLPPHMRLVTEVYFEICKLIGEDPNTESHVFDRIKSMANKQTLRSDLIKGHGHVKYITLASDVTLVINDLFSTDVNKKIEDNYLDIESVVLSAVKNQIRNSETLSRF